MLKKVAMIAVLATCSTLTLADDDVGCGAGTQIWKGQSGLVPKILAATTNGIFANQLFGITFGTLGCGNMNSTITAQARVTQFVDGNAEALARDMAVGQGESLSVLAQLMGVQDQDKQAFFSATKANFSTIYSAENQTTRQVLAALNQVLAKDSQLKAYSLS